MEDQPFKHPTGGRPEVVTILALGPTQQDFHSDKFTYTPQIPDADETWLINKGLRTLLGDLVFIMDDLVGESRISESYTEAIQRCRLPIITSIVDADVKGIFPDNNLVPYPIHQMIDFYGAHWCSRRSVYERQRTMGYPEPPAPMEFPHNEVREGGKRVASYLQNSIPLVLAYAGFIGVRTIMLFGADYDFPNASVHEADKPNAEYWVGMCYGLGIELRMSARTTLLNTNKGRPIYGYGARQPVL